MKIEPTPKPFQCWSCGFVVTARSEAAKRAAEFEHIIWCVKEHARRDHWILLDEISARCLADGVVTGRVQAQARQVVSEKWPGEDRT